MALTIEQYLIGQFEYEFSDLNIQSALECWGITAGVSHLSVGSKEKDLALSNLFMVLANVTSGGGKQVTKGNRTVKDKSFSFGITDRQNFREEAMRLRNKWGITDTSTTGSGAVDVTLDGDGSYTVTYKKDTSGERVINYGVKFGNMFER